MGFSICVNYFLKTDEVKQLFIPWSFGYLRPFIGKNKIKLKLVRIETGESRFDGEEWGSLYGWPIYLIKWL